MGLRGTREGSDGLQHRGFVTFDVHYDHDRERFTIAYEALIDDQTWNGWACPSFARSVAERVVTDQDVYFGTEDDERLLWRDGVVVSQYPQWLRDEGYEDTEYEPDADGRYPIGSWHWTWLEVDEAECDEVIYESVSARVPYVPVERWTPVGLSVRG